MQFEKRSGAYMTEKYPMAAVHILRYPTVSGSEVADDFIENIETYYFKETYEAEGFRTEWSENHLIMKSEAELKQVSKEAAKMISDAIEDPIFEKFPGTLQVQIEIKGSKSVCSLNFSGKKKSANEERAGDYYTDAENVEETLEETYKCVTVLPGGE